MLTAMKYFGGKARPGMRTWLNSLIPFDPKGVYVEPFAGMLGLLLSRPPAKNEIANDLDGHIYTFWLAMREHHEELRHLIRHTAHCRQTYEMAYHNLHTGHYDGNIIKRAWAVYVCVQHSMMHGLGTKGWGVQLCATRDRTQVSGAPMADRVQALHERIGGVQLENICAVELLRRLVDIDHATIYCDPPYEFRSTDVYGTDKLDRAAFFALLKAQKGKVAISGYGSEWDALGWEKREREVFFSHVGVAAKKTGARRTECLWMNYSPPTEQASLFEE